MFVAFGATFIIMEFLLLGLLFSSHLIVLVGSFFFFFPFIRISYCLFFQWWKCEIIAHAFSSFISIFRIKSPLPIIVLFFIPLIFNSSFLLLMAFNLDVQFFRIVFQSNHCKPHKVLPKRYTRLWFFFFYWRYNQTVITSFNHRINKDKKYYYELKIVCLIDNLIL